jgi:hypothetical protein
MTLEATDLLAAFHIRFVVLHEEYPDGAPNLSQFFTFFSQIGSDPVFLPPSRARAAQALETGSRSGQVFVGYEGESDGVAWF